MGAIDRKSWTERWGAKRALHRPSTFNSVPKQRSWHVVFFRPSEQALRSSVCCKEMISPSIPGLFGSSSPSTIFRRIVSVVVDSFERMLWCRWLAHITKKSLERFSPLPAYADTSSAVPKITWNLFSFTTSNHGKPCSIAFRILLSVLEVSRNTAAIFFPKLQQATKDDAVISAITKARPCGSPLFDDPHESNDGKFSESLVLQILDETRKRVTIGFSHCNLLFRFLVRAACGPLTRLRFAYYSGVASEWES